VKYIFKEKDDSPTQIGEMPIDYFQLCWYDMSKDQSCYDEDYITPRQFNIKLLTYIDTEEDKNDLDRTRLFLHHKDGDIYELCLHKIDKDKWSECSYFYGQKDL